MIDRVILQADRPDQLRDLFDIDLAIFGIRFGLFDSCRNRIGLRLVDNLWRIDLRQVLFFVRLLVFRLECGKNGSQL